MVIILFNGEHNTVYWRETFCRNSCRKRNILFKKKNSYRQNLRNATNLLSTFESSPTCLFNDIPQTSVYKRKVNDMNSDGMDELHNPLSMYWKNLK